MSAKIHALNTDVTRDINDGIKAMQATLSAFLFRGTVLVCLLTFIFLTIADILLPDVGRRVFICCFLSVHTNPRVRLAVSEEEAALAEKEEALAKAAGARQNVGCERGISVCW